MVVAAQVEKKPVLPGKKKGMNLQAFLSRKKIESMENSGQKDETNSKREVKEELSPAKQEIRNLNVLYVQIQAFKTLEIPKDVEKIKSIMAIAYLLGLEVHRDVGVWPNLIPVYNSDGVFRFIKKGKGRNEEVASLFQYMMTGISAAEWSTDMESIYEMYEINNDLNLLAEKVISDLNAIIYKEYQVNCTIEGKEVKEVAKITGPATLVLAYSECELPLEEFTI